MAKLTEDMKDAIVRRLACFEAPTQVAKAVGEEFGISIDRSQVAAYNAGTGSFEASQRWVYIFDAYRSGHLKAIELHAISHLGFRLAMLQRAALNAEEKGNYVLMAAMLEQAAKEMGGYYSGSRSGSGGDGTGGTLNINLDPRLPATAEEARAELIHKLENLRLRQIGAGKSRDISPT